MKEVKCYSVTVIKRGPTRRYDSRRRELAARETRRAIVSAARELFLEDGYIATTIEKIAERAGVSKPTVFASVGNKRALLKAARDLAMAGDDEPVPIAKRSWFLEALAEPDPRRSVRLHARNVRECTGKRVTSSRCCTLPPAPMRSYAHCGEPPNENGGPTRPCSLMRCVARARCGLVWTATRPSTSCGSSPAPKRSNDSFAPVAGASPATRSGSHRPSSISFFRHPRLGIRRLGAAKRPYPRL